MAEQDSHLHEHLLEVRDLEVDFDSDTGSRAVTDGVSFDVIRGETLGVVGESGCGKSVTSLAIMGLLPETGRVVKGSAVLRPRENPEGIDLIGLGSKELDRQRGDNIAMVFQDALASLDPVFTIGFQITEGIRAHRKISKKEAAAIAQELLDKVGLPDPAATMNKYPFELSGGMRQRAMIAMALSGTPELLIADEATTALDVTIQAQIIRLLRTISKASEMSILLITHDIALIAELADRVMVMYAGQIIEVADVRELFANPLHPYTKLLIKATPGILDETGTRLESIPGTVPENYSTIKGCRFAGRCPFSTPECGEPIRTVDVGGKTKATTVSSESVTHSEDTESEKTNRSGHMVRCRLVYNNER